VRGSCSLFQSIPTDKEGMIELVYYHFTPSHKSMDAGNDTQWLLTSQKDHKKRQSFLMKNRNGAPGWLSGWSM